MTGRVGSGVGSGVGGLGRRDLLFRELRLVGTSVCARADAVAALSLGASGRCDADSLVTEVVPPGPGPEVVDRLSGGQELKVPIQSPAAG